MNERLPVDLQQQQQFPCSLIHDMSVWGGEQDQLPTCAKKLCSLFEDVRNQFQINLAGLVIHTWVDSKSAQAALTFLRPSEDKCAKSQCWSTISKIYTHTHTFNTWKFFCCIFSINPWEGTTVLLFMAELLKTNELYNVFSVVRWSRLCEDLSSGTSYPIIAHCSE